MVDALRTAREWIVPTGRIVDLHPTAAVATIHVGAMLAGPIDPGAASSRHQAATDAIAAAVRDRLLSVEDAFEFEFRLHADSIDELDDYIAENWRDSRIGPDTLARARALISETPTAAISVREQVSAMRLRA
jgi:hypothetical protein